MRTIALVGAVSTAMLSGVVNLAAEQTDTRTGPFTLTATAPYGFMKRRPTDALAHVFSSPSVLCDEQGRLDLLMWGGAFRHGAGYGGYPQPITGVDDATD